MLTEKQQTVFDWLNDELELPVFAEAYKGALDVLDRKVPGYITFVSHAGRDLMNGLVPTVEDLKRVQVQYVQLVEEFKNDWKDEWGTEKFNTADSTENGHLIPYALCEKIKNLIDEHKAGRDRATEADSSFFITFLGYASQEEIPDHLSQEWRRAIKWFRTHAHLRVEPFDPATSYEVEQHFQTLSDFLYAAAGSDLEQLRGINEILEEANR